MQVYLIHQGTHEPNAAPAESVMVFIRAQVAGIKAVTLVPNFHKRKRCRCAR